MNYHQDAISQFKSIIEEDLSGVYNLYSERLEKVFCGIYLLNYLANRIEIKKLFSSNYFYISFSCLIESFSMISDNYPRGASLVLRSCIESFVKHIIVSECINPIISDRYYNANKRTLDKLIEAQYSESFQKESYSLNSKLETLYSKLSAQSHSLTPESKSNIVDYFSEVNNIVEKNIDYVIEVYLAVINAIVNFSVIISRHSLKEWDSNELKNILRIYFGKKRTRSLIRLIKE